MNTYFTLRSRRIRLSVTFLIFASLFTTQRSYAQENFSPAIEDNSFYIEEAYNQEPGVVQHIFTSEHLFENPHATNFTFTQEVPIYGLTNQLSYTVAYPTVANGTTVLYANYRYQLLYKHDWASVSPRISLYLPVNSVTGNLGRMSAQINIPVSKRLSNHFVTHVNFGATFDRCEWDHGNPISTSWTLGGSMIWLSSENTNFLFETMAIVNPTHGEENMYIVSPGTRFALNFGKTQVVPGIGFPMELSNAQWILGVFFYFSVELPYWTAEEQ